MNRRVYHYGDGSVKRREPRKEARKREELKRRAEYWQERYDPDGANSDEQE